MAGGKVVVDAQLMQGMLNYLSKCPYHKVAPLLVGVQGKIEPYKEPVKTEPEKVEPKEVEKEG